MITINLQNMAETLSHTEQQLETFKGQIETPQLYKANFVAEEVLTNLSRHADFESRDQIVILTLEVTAEKNLMMTFQDNSQPFNLMDFPDPTLSGDLEDAEPGGLGIFLTKQYAKEILYNYTNPYNILKITL